MAMTPTLTIAMTILYVYRLLASLSACPVWEFVAILTSVCKVTTRLSGSRILGFACVAAAVLRCWSGSGGVAARPLTQPDLTD